LQLAKSKLLISVGGEYRSLDKRTHAHVISPLRTEPCNISRDLPSEAHAGRVLRWDNAFRNHVHPFQRWHLRLACECRGADDLRCFATQGLRLTTAGEPLRAETCRISRWRILRMVTLEYRRQLVADNGPWGLEISSKIQPLSDLYPCPRTKLSTWVSPVVQV